MLISPAVFRRRRRPPTIITDLVPAELVWQDGPPTLTAFGATANSRAVVRNAEHQVLTALTPTYSSAATSVATVDSAGLCTAVANGTSVITASYAGVTSITQTATVSQTVASISGVSATLSTDDASSGTFSPSGLDATGHAVSGATFAYSSDQPSILSVNATSGAWAGQSAGTAHVTITASPGGATFVVTATVVHAAAPTLDHMDYTLSGSTATVGAEPPTGTVTKWQDAGETTPFTGSVSLSYSSSNTGVATINSSSGVITLVAAGSCTFTVTDSISTKSATTGTLTVSASGTVTAVAPVYNGQQSPQGLLLFGGVAPESALSLVDQTSTPITSGVTWASSDSTNAPINSSTGVISPSSGITTQTFVTFTGTHTASGLTATVTANVLKGGWQGSVIASDDLTDYAGTQAAADTALLNAISSHANDPNTSTNAWDPTGTVRQPTGPANARYIQCVNANWLQADATNRVMGRNSIKMWFPGGLGGSAQPQIVFTTSKKRVHHLGLERFDPGFTTVGDLTLYNNPGTGPAGDAASYKNGPWDGFSNYSNPAATTFTNSTQEQVAIIPGSATTTDWVTIGDMASWWTGANAGKWRLYYICEETIDNRVRYRKWAVALGTGTLTFLGECVGPYLDTVSMPSGIAQIHQSTILGANWNRTRAAAPGGTQTLNRGPWYIVDGDAASDPWGILAAVGEATPTLTSATVTTFNAGDTGTSVVLAGTNFTKNIAVVFSESNIRVQSVSYDSSTQMTVVVNVKTGLTPGASTLQLTNTALGTSSGTLAITTTAIPALSGVSPTSVVQGTTQDIVLTGKNFTSAAAGQSVVFSNAGISVNSTTFNSATQITANVTVSGSAATGAGTVKVHDTTNGDSNTKNIAVSSASLNVPAGLSGLGFFAEDFSSYANDTALKASSNVGFDTTSTSFGTLDTGTTYNSHSTFKNRLNTNAQAGIQIKSAIYNGAGYQHTAATYRSTVKWTAGHAIPTNGKFFLGRWHPQNQTSYEHDGANWFVQFYVQDVSGTKHYKLDAQLRNSGGGTIGGATGIDLGIVGAELANGYTIDYFVRITQTDSTHFTVKVWLAKNVGGTVASAMLLGSYTVTMGTADANLYQGNWYPLGKEFDPSTAASEQDTWLCQLEAIDETTNPDWYGLVNAGSYTPLT